MGNNGIKIIEGIGGALFSLANFVPIYNYAMNEASSNSLNSNAVDINGLNILFFFIGVGFVLHSIWPSVKEFFNIGD